MTPGDSSGHHGSGEGALGIQQAEAQSAVKHPTAHRTVPPKTKRQAAQDANSADVEKNPCEVSLHSRSEGPPSPQRPLELLAGFEKKDRIHGKGSIIQWFQSNRNPESLVRAQCSGKPEMVRPGRGASGSGPGVSGGGAAG